VPGSIAPPHIYLDGMVLNIVQAQLYFYLNLHMKAAIRKSVNGLRPKVG